MSFRSPRMILLALLLPLLAAGCGAKQVRDVQTSGFLGDYSGLKPGPEGYAALLWYKPDINLRVYDKILLDPVRVVLKGEAAQRGIEPHELAELTDEYQDELVKALTEHNGYALVAQPGRGVLRIRVAVTDVVPGNAVMGTLSSVNPVGLAVSGGIYAATGTQPYVGEASTEMEILDSPTGERLAAMVDRRIGGKAPFRGTYDDARDAFAFWAERLRQRLDEGRAAPR